MKIRDEFKEYIEKLTDLTADEKKELREWVDCGHSVYDNPFGVCDERGMTMDYIEALRIYNEPFVDEMYTQNDSLICEESSEMDPCPCLGYPNVSKILCNMHSYSALDIKSCCAIWIGNVSLHNGNGVSFSIKTQNNRRDAVKGVILYLSYIRDAEKRDLKDTSENMKDTDEFKLGENAVDALEEIICLLDDGY